MEGRTESPTEGENSEMMTTIPAPGAYTIQVDRDLNCKGNGIDKCLLIGPAAGGSTRWGPSNGRITEYASDRHCSVTARIEADEVAIRGTRRISHFLKDGRTDWVVVGPTRGVDGKRTRVAATLQDGKIRAEDGRIWGMP